MSNKKWQKKCENYFFENWIFSSKSDLPTFDCQTFICLYKAFDPIYRRTDVFLLHFVFFMFLNSMVNLGVKHRCRWGILRFGGCRLFKLCNNGSWKVSWEDVCLFFSCSRLHFWFFLCLWFRIRSQTCVVLQAENRQLGFSVWTQLLLIWIVLHGRYLQRGWISSPSRQRCLYQTQEVSSVSR